VSPSLTAPVDLTGSGPEDSSDEELFVNQDTCPDLNMNDGELERAPSPLPLTADQVQLLYERRRMGPMSPFGEDTGNEGI